jgi:hypothetical protein
MIKTCLKPFKCGAFFEQKHQNRALPPRSEIISTRVHTLENHHMKLPLLGAVAAMTFAIATTTMAAESSTQDSASAAPDSTVMTQTKNVKAETKQHKQVQADENKRGRPAASSSKSAN